VPGLSQVPVLDGARDGGRRRRGCSAKTPSREDLGSSNARRDGWILCFVVFACFCYGTGQFSFAVGFSWREDPVVDQEMKRFACLADGVFLAMGLEFGRVRVVQAQRRPHGFGAERS